MIKVQCHEPSGSRPGFIVLQSDYIDNLRSTYTQLQRCFSTSYKDIMDINDNEHALMPKLKDIYRKVGFDSKGIILGYDSCEILLQSCAKNYRSLQNIFLG